MYIRDRFKFRLALDYTVHTPIPYSPDVGVYVLTYSRDESGVESVVCVAE